MPRVLNFIYTTAIVIVGFFTITGAIVNLYAAYQSSKPAQPAVTTEFIVSKPFSSDGGIIAIFESLDWRAECAQILKNAPKPQIALILKFEAKARLAVDELLDVIGENPALSSQIMARLDYDGSMEDFQIPDRLQLSLLVKNYIDTKQSETQFTITDLDPSVLKLSQREQTCVQRDPDWY